MGLGVGPAILCKCLSQQLPVVGPRPPCLKSPGRGETCPWLACRVAECAAAVPGSQEAGPHCDQAWGVLSLTQDTFVTEDSVFNLYRIVRVFY